MSKILTIEENLQLRELELNDYKDIFQTIDTQRKYLGKWLPFVEFTQEPEDSKNFVKSVLNVSSENFEYIFTIRCENQFVGLIGFKNSDKQNKKTEIGYWLSEKFQGKGIVSKAVQCLCDFAFNELGMNRIQIKCAFENEKSNAIPKRLGFTFEGVERHGELLSDGVFVNLKIYSLLHDDTIKVE